MKDITPKTDSDTQVTVGDKVRIRWLLDAQVNPDYLTFTVQQNGTQKTFSGADLTETLVTVDGDRLWRYHVDYEIRSTFEQVEFRLKDPVNRARDSAHYTATPTVI